MTREETVKLLGIITHLYPTTFRLSEEELTGVADAWTVLLKPYPFGVVQKELIAYTKKGNEYPPNVGQLIAAFEVEESAESEWVKVRKAICNSNYHAEEEFNKLSPKTQKAVGSPWVLSEWARTEIHIIDTSIAKQFKDSFNGIGRSMEYASKIGCNENDKIEEKNPANK